jgi:hypothetical protein
MRFLDSGPRVVVRSPSDNMSLTDLQETKSYMHKLLVWVYNRVLGKVFVLVFILAIVEPIFYSYRSKSHKTAALVERLDSLVTRREGTEGTASWPKGR